MKKVHAFRLALVIGLGAVLSGCWIPEQFNAEVSVNRDGSYTLRYDGVMTFALALLTTKEGAPAGKDEIAWEKAADSFKSDPEFKSVQYLGKGRYKVLVEKTGKPGESYSFPSSLTKIFTVEPQPDGTIVLSAAQYNQKALDGLKSIGAKVDGRLTVTVGRGVEVISHNAASEPSLFGLIGGYKWELKSIDAAPRIVVRPGS